MDKAFSNYFMPQQELQRVIQYTDLATWRRRTPKSWNAAAGLLRHKKKSLERHVEKIRKEWDRKIF